MLRKVLKELRPPTLVVTVLSTSLGIVTAYIRGYIFSEILWDVWRISLVTLAGIFLQGGVNLVNNFFEETLDEEVLKKRKSDFLGYKRSREEIVVFQAGLLFFLLTIVIGILLAIYSGVQLLAIELVGAFAAYGYAGPPFNYKRLGLGAVMTFLMMGPLMVYGSYYIFSRSFSFYPILYSFSLCLFIPAVLIANELRDFYEDKSKGVRTLTVRMGYGNGVRVYCSLIGLPYFITAALILSGYLPALSAIVFTTLFLIKRLIKYLKFEKRLLVPATARFYLIYGLQLILVLILAGKQ